MFDLFSDYDFALTMLQVSSGLAGLSLVATGFIPLLLERVHGRYEAFVAERRIRLVLFLTKLAFGSFVLSVLLSLVWTCLLVASVQAEILLILSGIGGLATFVVGLILAAFIVFRFLTPEMFVK